MEQIFLRNGDQYIGEIDGDKKLCGKGQYIFANKISKYEGQFQNNKFHGQGQLTTSEYIIIGNFKQGVIDDVNCIIYYKDGSQFKGSVKENKKNGQGNYIFQENEQYKEYIGNFLNDQFHGEGWLKFRNEEQEYRGQFQNGLMIGIGILKNNEMIYEGDFDNGYIDGKGVLKFLKEGEEYKGDFKKGKFEGRGVYTFNGAQYRGQFKNGQPHGSGILNIDDPKQVYEGDFSNGLFENYGKYQIQEIFFEGLFNQNYADGKGMITHQDGSKFEGYFQRNMKHGPCTFIVKDKMQSTYKGEFVFNQEKISKANFGSRV